MTTATTSSATLDLRQPRTVVSLVRHAWRLNAPLTLVGILMIGVLLAALIGLFVDHQVITGMPAWVKPAKFAISISIYCFTLVYLLTFVRGHRRLVALTSVVTALGMVIEMVIIAGQVIRGTTSHFNVSTPLNGFLWSTMGSSIVVVWAMGLIIAFLLLRQPQADAVWAWCLRLGMLIALLGMAVAFFMVTPTAAQLAAAHAGQGLPISGAHTVGRADGGPGLPFVGWSTVAGDVRISHFVGLHALQVFLIVGWLLRTPRGMSLGAQRRLALVWTFAVGYVGLVALLLWQALRGQPIVAPDALTLATGGALFLAVALAGGVILLRGQRG